MKVLFVQHADGIGGSAISLRYLIAGVRAAVPALEPHVMISRNAGPALTSLYEPLAVKFHSLPSHSTVDASVSAQGVRDRLDATMRRVAAPLGKHRITERMEALIAGEGIDLVHLNSSVLAPIAQVLIDLHIPFIWHVREPVSNRRSGAVAWVRRLMQEAPALIFLSASDCRSWLGEAATIGQVTIVPNAVDFQRFRPDGRARRAVRERLSIAEDAPVVLYVGGAVKIKGVSEIVRAIDIVSESVPDVRLLMPGTAYTAGGGTLARVARWGLRKVSRPTLGDAVRAMLERRPETCVALTASTNVEEYYAAADVVAFPSLVPHFARPVIEALASMRAVVASDLDGVRELLPQAPGVGTLVPPGDPPRLADALIEHLLQRREVLDQLTSARREAQQRFSLDRHGSIVADLYLRVLGEF